MSFHHCTAHQPNRRDKETLQKDPCQILSLIRAWLARDRAAILARVKHVRVQCRAVFAVLILITPLSLLIMVFPCLVIVRSVLCLFGSVKRVEENSATFSGREPRPWQGPLPRVTVQMPVFMEDLDFVIRPSVK